MSLLNLLYITWDVDPVAFSIFGWGVRWYGIAYALSFMVGFYILSNIFKAEGKPAKDVDNLVVGTILGIILGARFGHVFFYSDANSSYWSEPWTIFYVWEGGMASHGAVIGILIAIYLYSRKRPDQPYLWVTDRMTTVIGFGAAMVRLGNLLNSEIVGRPTDVPWAFYFKQSFSAGEEGAINGIPIPRHPVVLYEAIAYLLVFGLFLWLFFKKYKRNPPQGMMTGLILALVFVIRFCLEFFKTPQEEYTPLIEGITTGQLLSLPAIVAGIAIMAWALKRNKRQPPQGPKAEPAT